MIHIKRNNTVRPSEMADRKKLETIKYNNERLHVCDFSYSTVPFCTVYDCNIFNDSPLPPAIH